MFNVRQSKRSVLLNRFFTTLHSFLVMKHQITYKQRKWAAMFPQMLLKTLSINSQSLSCFTLLMYHFTRRRHREKHLFGDQKHKGKNSTLALSTPFLVLCKHKSIVFAMRKRTEDIRRQIIWKVLCGVYLICFPQVDNLILVAYIPPWILKILTKFHMQHHFIDSAYNYLLNYKKLSV